MYLRYKYLKFKSAGKMFMIKILSNLLKDNLPKKSVIVSSLLDGYIFKVFPVFILF